jgi:hypothetical protein
LIGSLVAGLFHGFVYFNGKSTGKTTQEQLEQAADKAAHYLKTMGIVMSKGKPKMESDFISVPWSADPDENRKNIVEAFAEARRSGKKVRWDSRPYALRPLDQPRETEGVAVPEKEATQ